jgi:alpha-L-rhamnosidase
VQALWFSQLEFDGSTLMRTNSLRPGAVGSIAAVLVLSSVQPMARDSRIQELRKEFENPPKIYRPMVRWWWPGGDVNDEELKREVRLLDEAGFGGGEIQPFRIGLNPQAPAEVQKRINNYLTPEFYGYVRAALEEAARRGMWLDYTLGSGWPFGGGNNITPELASMELRFAEQSLQGPSRFSAKLPMPQRPPGMRGCSLARIGSRLQ